MPGAGATDQPWQGQHQAPPERGTVHALGGGHWDGISLWMRMRLLSSSFSLRAFARGKEDGLPKTSHQWARASQVLVKGEGPHAEQARHRPAALRGHTGPAWLVARSK